MSYKTIKKYNTMKKTTLILLALFAWVWQTNAQYFSEGFEGGTFPPTGWTLTQTNANQTWISYTDDAQEGTTSASCEYDSSLGAQDELLLSPVIDLTSASGQINLSFWFNMSYYWSVDPNDNYDLKVQATTDGGATFTDLWSEADYGTFTNWTWTNAMIDLSAYAGTNNLQIGFRYVGTDGAQAIIDNISIIDAAPEATFTANPDCANGQFSVDVNVTDFHGATSVTVSDDQGSTSQQLSAPGTVSFGPYASGTTVHYMVVNDQNNATFSQDFSYFCPATNDDCASAAALTLEQDAITTYTPVDNSTATFSGVPAPSCGSYNASGLTGDLWYAVTIPTGAQGVTFDVANVSGLTSVAGALYSGDCSNLVEVGCTEFSSGWPWTLTGLTQGDTYYLRVWDYNNDQTGSFDLGGFYTQYVNPEFTLTVSSPDCTNNVYSVDVEVTNLGGSSSVTIADDQGSTSQQLSAPGTVTFGTYPVGTNVTFTVTSDDNNTFTATNNIQYYCPPANDDCTSATVLGVDPTTCSTPIVGTNVGASDSGIPFPSCSSAYAYGTGGDVWFSVTVPASGSVSIETSQVSGSSVGDTVMAAYSGDCSNLVEIGCDDDGGPGLFSKIELTGQTAGEVLYIRVYEYGNNSFGEFNICAWDPDASSVEDNQIAGFKFYPNPVNHTLNLSAQNNIENVNIFNVTGQQVISVKPEATQTQIDMSKLQNGIYFVKAQINGEMTAFKVVKK